MMWNWQQQDWPNFAYDPAKVAGMEQQLLRAAGIFSGTLRHVGEADKSVLMIDLMSNEALKSSEIEGEILNRDSVQSSIRKNFGLVGAVAKGRAAEEGIAEMMVDLYQTWDQPLSHDALFTWHRLLTRGRRDLQDIGKYRTHEEPMQVVSNALYDPEIHFEAPPSKNVPEEMEQFIMWFNRTAPNGAEPLPALIRAAIAHLYFVCIHPFEDGNGRIGRAIAEKALSQNLQQPTLIAVSQIIQSRRKIYYQSLEDNNKDLHINAWIEYFAQTILTAQDYTQSVIDFLIAKTKLYDRIKNQLNERQNKVVTRLLLAGPEGFAEGLSAKKYIKMTGTSTATASRDLHDLVEKGALTKAGELRHTRYFLNI